MLQRPNQRPVPGQFVRDLLIKDNKRGNELIRDILIFVFQESGCDVVTATTQADQLIQLRGGFYLDANDASYFSDDDYEPPVLVTPEIQKFFDLGLHEKYCD